ncbi:hypothetical protein [Bifidobacterium myosotis]|uniref:Uncharacterized protein n=1 Tax=Bifidobacterium myosotis TaxID=1630166 RepID=A0A5M9ZHA7_9BIFI|nr:hypothetical protein [Bifidobacterium myosotis]KAA8826984.1 hypothetical protein EMO91_10665 [Bifidobacterium myosotis]
MTEYRGFEKRLLPIARRWHGVIPVWAAREEGIDPSQLRHWAAGNDDVDHPARGIYVWYNDDPRTDYRYTHLAQALAEAGPGAVFYGPTVVKLLHLGGWGSQTLHIAVPSRRRKRYGIQWHHDTGFPRRKLHGLPIQEPRLAIIDSLPVMNGDKRDMVLFDAVNEGYLTQREADELV